MDKPLIPEDLMQYIDGLVPPRPKELLAMEKKAKEKGFPIIGPTTGYLCYQVARMTRAHRIFELGSGFGYSTAWFARAVNENGGGEVHHVVWDDDLSREARSHLAILGDDSVVRFHVGEAVQTLQETDGPFDLIFNDIDKQDYPASLPVIAAKMRPGGVLIVDNLLWGGRIFDPGDKHPTTEGVRRLTDMLVHDPAWIISLIPVRDGVMLAYKV